MLDVALEKDSVTGDLINIDMGEGLPFRPGIFDGVISISALQWLCYADNSNQDPKLRLNKFFSSLYSIMKKDARAVLQFYPENEEQALLIAQSASKVGFAGGVVIDFPNSSKAKKYYLCLSFERSYRVPVALTEENQTGVQVTNRNNTQSRSNRHNRVRADIKKKDWITHKKERRIMQGKQVKSNSKFTGRKRRDIF